MGLWSSSARRILSQNCSSTTAAATLSPARWLEPYRCCCRQPAAAARRQCRPWPRLHAALHTSAARLSGQQELRDAEITRAVSQLAALLEDGAASAAEIWAKYDQLKIRRIVAFIPFEMWAGLLKACQQAPPPASSAWQARPESALAMRRGDGGRRRSGRPEGGGGGGGGAGHAWTRAMAKRRALMLLGDMWRSSGAEAAAPAAFHYNVVFDVICRDPAAAAEELLRLHRDMRLHGVQEDCVTFNTLLNGCRRLGAWGFFREIDDQVRRRDAWGITRMDAATWGTLVQGYRQCQDWRSVDQCVALASQACRAWGQPGGRGVRPTAELWSIIVNAYAARDMVPQMLAARRAMTGLGLAANAFTFGPVFAALHRMRRRLVRDRRDAWPAISHALREFEAMRSAGVAPNASILTNVVLTVGLNNPHAGEPAQSADSMDDATNQAQSVDSMDDATNQAQSVDIAQPTDSTRSAVTSIGGSVARELEQLLARAHDPNIYATLLNVGARTGSYSDIQEVWQTLLAEAPHAPDALLTSLTLAAYMNALNACKMYEAAVEAFYAHAMPAPSGNEGRRDGSASTLRLRALDRPVYEAALMAFARTDRHRMCATVIRAMISKGVAPSVLALRYTLLPPDQAALARRPSASQYTRRWSLPLATARSVWSLVSDARRAVWAHGAGAASGHEQPVIVNDIAAQLIRIAAYARCVDFGEEVFAALRAEAAHFGPGQGEGCLPADLQCSPNVRTYTSMITLYGNDADLAGVARMWESMLRDGVEPNLHTYTSLVVALHKVALRRRWKDAQPPQDEGCARLPWESTQQDLVIGDIEGWIVDSAEAPGWLRRSASPRLDVPLSTLLLRYHALRIRDTLRGPEADLPEHVAAVEHSTADSIQRAMRVCHAVEAAGLTPDHRFHAALADFLDTCGDWSGAELVRRRMDGADLCRSAD